MSVLECNEDSFEDMVINSDLPVVVDFYAPWCGPCKMIKPHLEKLSETYGGKVKIVAIDTDENQNLAQEYQIRSLPTLMFFTKTSVTNDTIVGTTSPAKIEEKIQKIIGA